MSKIEGGLLPHISTDIKVEIKDAVTGVLNGNVCLINKKNNKKGILFNVKKVEQRSLTEPANENIIKGSKEAFIENISVNIGLVRNRLKTSDLKVKEMKIGEDTSLNIAILYLDKKVDSEVLKKLIKRIENIATNKLASISDIEEQIIDKKYSIFPQVLFTEKTDKFVGNIVEGKIGLIIDGVPIAYIIPALFNMFFQAPEDYSANYAISTSLRILRYLCMIVTLVSPALYVAITTFHQEMVPTELAISIIESKQGDPFPVLIEVVFMLIAFEILIEASTRLPKTIGQTVSIVGGLIIGEAAVSANFVSPAVVVIIAITGIAGFLMPNQDFSNALRICRFFLLLISGVMSVYGLALGLIVIFYYLATIESFGVPYLMPFSSNEGKNILTDTIIREPMVDIKQKSKRN
jgi:spore germination protein KA